MPTDAKTLVFVHAHPDDEALLTAGTMARAVAEGRRVVLVVATDGAAGLAQGPGPRRLGRLGRQPRQPRPRALQARPAGREPHALRLCSSVDAVYIVCMHIAVSVYIYVYMFV